MQKTIGILFIMFSVSCRLLPNAQGEINQINILSSPEDRVLIEGIIEKYFSEKIHTPQPENLFELNWVDPWETELWENSFNIILISLQFPEDSTGDYFSDRFRQASNTKEPMFLRNDVYAKDQLFFNIQAQDIIQFRELFEVKSRWIFTEIKQAYHNRLQSIVYSKGLNIELMEKIQLDFGFSMKIQQDFIIVDENREESFIWLGRGHPYRWLTIHKLSREEVTNHQFWEIFLQRISTTMPQISISEYYRSITEIQHIDQNISVLRGIYDHRESNSGGPFFSYIIKDSDSDDMYLISGYVNYPGHKKLNLLNQLEILAQSIKF